jgi:hypothetical protein
MGMSRRRFLKRLGVTLPAATVVGKMGNSELLASREEYGGFLVRRYASGYSEQADPRGFWKKGRYVHIKD